ADQNPSEPTYEKLFFDPANPPPPRDISDGEELVTWYSVTVKNDKFSSASPLGFGSNTKFQGTIMIHGFYFAHNSELGEGESPFWETINTELRKPWYQPQVWRRFPNRK